MYSTNPKQVLIEKIRLLKQGFTLIEILVAVLIIGILAAIAVPQYQRALLKSRYAALMPIAKSMANSNEAYYLEHGIYADDPQDLLIQGQSRYTDDTELEFGTVSDYAYVLAKNEDKIPNNTFVVYQKHSGEFPGEIHCEALADNDLAESVCKSFGGNESIGKTLTDGYETYVLFGTGNGVAPEPPCDGVACDAQGNITECASGLTLNNGECVACNIANAATCSTTSYAATECITGYKVQNGVCVEVPSCPGTQPDDIVPGGSNPATATATCVNGQWKYVWTGGNTYGNGNKNCFATSAYACAGSTFNEADSTCQGYSGSDNGCMGSIFSGERSKCYGDAANVCGSSIFSGEQSACYGWVANGCAGAEIQAGARCLPDTNGGCDGVKYGAHPDKDPNLIGSCEDQYGYCPTGVPVTDFSWNETTKSYNITGWKGNCCNPAYMVSGTCPSGIAVCGS